MSLLVGIEDKLSVGVQFCHLSDRLFLGFSKHLMKYWDEEVGGDKLTKYLCLYMEDGMGQV